MKCEHAGPDIIITSFCDLTGSTVVKGKTIFWEHSDMFGPSFTDKDGEILAKQPGPRSAAWKAYEAWYDELAREGVLIRSAEREELL